MHLLCIDTISSVFVTSFDVVSMDMIDITEMLSLSWLLMSNAQANIPLLKLDQGFPTCFTTAPLETLFLPHTLRNFWFCDTGLNEPHVFVYNPLQKKTKKRSRVTNSSILVIKMDASWNPWNDVSHPQGFEFEHPCLGTTEIDYQNVAFVYIRLCVRLKSRLNFQLRPSLDSDLQRRFETIPGKLSVVVVSWLPPTTLFFQTLLRLNFLRHCLVAILNTWWLKIHEMKGENLSFKTNNWYDSVFF